MDTTTGVGRAGDSPKTPQRIRYPSVLVSREAKEQARLTREDTSDAEARAMGSAALSDGPPRRGRRRVGVPSVFAIDGGGHSCSFPPRVRRTRSSPVWASSPTARVGLGRVGLQPFSKAPENPADRGRRAHLHMNDQPDRKVGQLPLRQDPHQGRFSKR